jgi:hypothetical protein
MKTTAEGAEKGIEFLALSSRKVKIGYPTQ